LKIRALFVLGFLFYINLVSSAFGAPAAPIFLKNFPHQSFHQLKSGKQIVGKSDFQWKVEGPQRISFVEKSSMKLTLFQKTQEISTHVETVTNENLEIQKFVFSMKTSEATIEVSGERIGSNLRLKVTQAGSTQTKELPIQEPLLLSPTIRPFLLMKGLPKSKETYSGFLLEPSALTTIPLTMSVELASPKKYAVDVRYLSQSLKSEMEPSGALIKEVSDLAGMPIEASPVSAAEYKQLVLTAPKEDLVEVARVGFPPISNSKDLRSFSVKISGVDLKPFELNRNRQKLDRDILTVKVESLPSQTLPVQALIGQKQYEPYLQGDSSIAVFDPLIQKKAKEIVGNESDLWKRAKLIFDFVNTKVEKVPTVSVPNALEVLKTMKGDCNEHSVLYTALARAAGVPTRMVVGLVYGERMAKGSGFYYHAWVEVFTGKDWIAIDPTWNQIPADATHLAFVEGGLEQQVQVTSLMGKIQLSPH